MPSFALADAYPYYLANRPVFANTDLAVTDKYTGEVATWVAMADEAAIDEAMVAAEGPWRMCPNPGSWLLGTDPWIDHGLDQADRRERSR